MGGSRFYGRFSSIWFILTTRIQVQARVVLIFAFESVALTLYVSLVD